MAIKRTAKRVYKIAKGGISQIADTVRDESKLTKKQRGASRRRAIKSESTRIAKRILKKYKF